MVRFENNKLFEIIGYDNILTILDKKYRVNKEGITFALFEPSGQPFPYFYYFPNINEALEMLVKDHEFEELFDDMILDTAARYTVEEDANYDSEEELTFLKSRKENDFEFFNITTNEPTKVTHKYYETEYHFATEKDAQRFVKAVQEKFYKLLQGALKDHN